MENIGDCLWFSVKGDHELSRVKLSVVTFISFHLFFSVKGSLYPSSCSFMIFLRNDTGQDMDMEMGYDMCICAHGNPMLHVLIH
jgi:hypothetical protein